VAIDYEGPINAMLGATAVGVTAGVVTQVSQAMLKGINQPQRQVVGRKTSKKSSKAKGYKAKQFSTKGTGKGLATSWGGDFSNIGY